ncbi:hypothetical protein TGAM01_v200130 [Trichoderma gamsii]|uniref:Uncharacterized protein n=1 Tax=Trichoderma gamsii TaxID=398673 RepID=A0A2P5A2D9_9HYPO|nr:hypothetical protein TGAM01_v200130 [Trichoderma gamsii]PON30710.1 hypothetical protein TGAM01_v200130 [Trichoderma gamsii]
MGRTAALPFAPHRQQHGAAKTAGHVHIGVFLGANLHRQSSAESIPQRESHAVLGQATLWIVP